MTGTRSAPAAEPTRLDPKRHPAALSGAIESAWRPYRWRGYAVGMLTGVIVGGVAAPIATTTVRMVLYVMGAGFDVSTAWWEGVWSIAFAVTTAAAGATAFAGWQPERLRKAAQTYIWLASQAEATWGRVVGAQPVPRDERGMRASLASIPETPATAGERFGLWIGLLDLDRARSAVAEMPHSTACERYGRASAAWLIDFVAGTTTPLEPLDVLVAAIDDSRERMQAAIGLAVNHARAALATGQDWQAPLAAVREGLGAAPLASYNRHVWRPMFRTLLTACLIGVAVYWLAVIGLGT